MLNFPQFFLGGGGICPTCYTCVPGKKYALLPNWIQSFYQLLSIIIDQSQASLVFEWTLSKLPTNNAFFHSESV